jgi:parvulin-like peptidyl-prolyl isomerase
VKLTICYLVGSVKRTPRFHSISRESALMRSSFNVPLACLLITAALPVACTQAPAPAAQLVEPAPAVQPAAPAAAPKTEAPPKPANLDQVLAAVGDQKITRGELLRLLGRFPVPQEGAEQVYHDAMERLVNQRLIGQYLNRQRIAASPETVNEAIAQIERNLKANGRGDLQSALQQTGETMEDLRRSLAWDELIKLRATDAELKKFVKEHNDLVTGTLLKGRHILLKVPDRATAADKEKIREKLLAIKQDIVDKKTSFAAAANAFSEDPANAEGSGGDIGYFSLTTGLVPEFAEAAFALKPGEISDPVETIHGFHLIEILDRKPGRPVDFEQQKDYILRLYKADLEKQVLAAERKSTEEKHALEIQPMPADLFAPTPSDGSTSAAAPNPGATSAAPKP